MRPATTSRRSVIATGAALAATISRPDWSPVSAAQSTPTAPVTIEYWHINTDAYGLVQIRQLIAMFQERHPSITVQERFLPDLYPGVIQNIQLGVAAGNPPDVVQIGNGYVRFTAGNLPFIPITDLAAIAGNTTLLPSLAGNIAAIGQVESIQVGVPYSLSATFTYINADMFQRAGLDLTSPPKTWADWEAAGQAIRGATGKPALLIVEQPGLVFATQTILASNGAGLTMDDGSGNAVSGFTTPAGIAAIQQWATSVENGTVSNVLTGEEAYQLFFDQEVAAITQTNAVWGTLTSQATFPMSASTFPAFTDQPLRLATGGNVLSVFAQDPAKQIASLAFIDFLLSPEALTVWDQGTGYLPPREELTTDPAYLGDTFADPVLAKAAESLKYAGPWQSFPGENGLQCEQLLHDAIEAAINDPGNVQSLLEDVATQIDTLIAGEAYVA